MKGIVLAITGDRLLGNPEGHSLDPDQFLKDKISDRAKKDLTDFDRHL